MIFTDGGPPEGHPLGIGSITKHAIDAVHVAINILVSNIPRRASHVFQPLLFHLLYFVFAALFWVCGGRDYYENPYIYQYIDFNEDRWSATLIMLAFLLATVPMYYILYAIGKMRDHVIKHFGCGKEPRRLLNKRNKVLFDIVGRSTRKVVPKNTGGVFLCCGHDLEIIDEGSTQQRFRGTSRRRYGGLVTATRMGNIVTGTLPPSTADAGSSRRHRKGGGGGGMKASRRAALPRSGHTRPQPPGVSRPVSNLQGERSVVRSVPVLSLLYLRWLFRKVCCVCWKSEFRARNFRLNHTTPGLFGHGQVMFVRHCIINCRLVTCNFKFSTVIN